MSFYHFNEEVVFSNDPIVRVRREDISVLKEMSRDNERKRIRLCAHKDTRNRLHEMLIVHEKGTYVRPHKHLNKEESLHVIEGAVDIVLFDAEGAITEVIPMSDYVSGQDFYYRLPGSYYHTLLIRSDLLIFHETTSGPFDRSETIFAPWSPDEKDETARDLFMAQLAQAVETFRQAA